MKRPVRPPFAEGEELDRYLIDLQKYASYLELQQGSNIDLTPLVAHIDKRIKEMKETSFIEEFRQEANRWRSLMSAKELEELNIKHNNCIDLVMLYKEYAFRLSILALGVGSYEERAMDIKSCFLKGVSFDPSTISHNYSFTIFGVHLIELFKSLYPKTVALINEYQSLYMTFQELDSNRDSYHLEVAFFDKYDEEINGMKIRYDGMIPKVTDNQICNKITQNLSLEK